MKTYTSRSSDQAKAIRSTVRGQFSVTFIAAVTSFALVFGQGGPSTKAGL